MNDTQRLLVIASLVAIGLVLAFVFLDWGDGAFSSLGGNRIAILAFNKDTMGYGYGLYTTHGIAGVLLGLIAPLLFFVGATFIALAVKARE
jgi:hypothetical protein